MVNSLYNYPTNMVFFTTPELLEIGDIPMTSLNEKPGRTEALKYYRRVADLYELDIHQYEQVDRHRWQRRRFHGAHHRPPRRRLRSYRARKVILATGYYDRPNMLDVPGEDLPKVIHYYKEAHPYYDMDVAVIGGKNSAAIAALELYWTGARVTLIHRDAQLSDHIKYWILPNIENRIKNGEVRGVLQFIDHRDPRPARSTSRRRTGMITLQERLRLRHDRLPSRTSSSSPSTASRSTPETQRPYTDPDSLESARKGIYLAGVLVAGMQTNEIFIENGRFHGKQIADALAAELKPAAG